MTQLHVATARMNVSTLLALLIAGLVGLSAGADIAVASNTTSDAAPAPAAASVAAAAPVPAPAPAAPAPAPAAANVAAAAPAPAASANAAASKSEANPAPAAAAESSAKTKPVAGSPSADAKPSPFNAPHGHRGNKKDSSSEEKKNERRGNLRQGPGPLQPHDNKQGKNPFPNQAQGKHNGRARRDTDAAQMALLTAMLSSKDSSDSQCCDESGKANTNDRLVDQINIVMAKLQNCKRNYYGYPFPYYY